MPLTADQIRTAAAKRRKTADVEVTELGGIVRLRALSAGDIVRLDFARKQYEKEGRDIEEIAFDYIARSWVDEQGELLVAFEEGVLLAKGLDATAHTKLLTAVLELNGLSAKAIEDAGKN